MKDQKVRCSINRKWFVGPMGEPADRGTPVHCWCEDPLHPQPIAILSAVEELRHDIEFHGVRP